MMGYPYSDLTRMKSGYLPIEEFPIEGDPLPKKADGTEYAGWLLFFDELTSAKEETQAAAYKVILDRKAGMKNIHPKVAMVAAGNLESDNAVVYPMSTALQTRMVHLKLRLDINEWVNWAIDKGFDHRITDYIQFKQDNLYLFDPNHTDLTYASPRTWEFTKDILDVCNGDVKEADFLPLAAGCVTEGVARDFSIYCDIYTSIPKISDILSNPNMIQVPVEPGHLFALSGSIGSHADKGNIDKLFPYIIRMPVEFQVVTLKYAIKMQPILMTNPTISKWVTEHGARLF